MHNYFSYGIMSIMISFTTLPKKITIFLNIKEKEEHTSLYYLHLKEIEMLQMEILKQMARPGDALYSNIMNEIRTHKMQAQFHNPNASSNDKIEAILFFQQFTSGVLKEVNKSLQ